MGRIKVLFLEEKSLAEGGYRRLFFVIPKALFMKEEMG
jgi:hypothetical protein